MNVSVIEGPNSIGFAVIAFAAVLVVAGWVILAGSRFVQGGVVERPERVPQLYGYTACLIGLIWALSSAVSVIDNALTLSAPELRETDRYGMEPSVTSFEAFRASYDRVRRFSAPDPRDVKLDSVPEPELRRRYEALRADRIAQGRFQARRAIIRDTLSFVIAAALFVFHWRWLRRRAVATA